jgi:hypothetical protein
MNATHITEPTGTAPFCNARPGVSHQSVENPPKFRAFSRRATGAAVAVCRFVMRSQQHRQPHERQDGLGTRRVDIDPQFGRVEILDLAPAFTGGAAEQAIRSRAARTADLPAGMVAHVHRIDRTGTSLSIVSGVVDGLLLSDLLSAMRAGTVMVNDAVLLELATTVIRGVGALHELPGAFAHGALAASHIALTPGGGVLLTDAAISMLLQDRQYNRERLWKEHGLVFPSSATLPRFDQRADVTQLGAAVLAILLRRPLELSEYPRRVFDLTFEATAGNSSYGPAIRMWVQQALQLHPRSVFASAADASRAFEDLTVHVAARRTSAEAFQRLIREMLGRGEETAGSAADVAARQPLPASPRTTLSPLRAT